MLETTVCTTAVDEFKRGVRFLRDGHPEDALVHFRRATELGKQNPYYLSFLGLSITRSEGKWVTALELCKEALRLKRRELQLHLNLVEVYVAAGQPEDAVRTLDGAQRCFGADSRIERVRKRLGKRRSPVSPSLSRSHFLNRQLGRLRHRVLGCLR